MRFLKTEGTYEELGDAWVEYRKYLLSIEHRLPAEAFEFAMAPWHHNPSDHRSLHDSWVESVSMSEGSAVSKPRTLRIDVALLAPYHDGITRLTYEGVRSYSFHLNAERGHGDWLLDEVRLSNNGQVIHEVAFTSGATWIIECESLRHSTTVPPI